MFNYRELLEGGNGQAGNAFFVIESELELFVGKNDSYYKEKWVKSRHCKPGWSWNSGAAIFTAIWCGYRKQYKLALLFLLFVLLSAALAYYMGWNYTIPFINVTPIMLTAIVLGMIFFGLFANRLYYRYALRKIHRIKTKGETDEKTKAFFIQRSGGTSCLGLIVMLVLSTGIFFLSHMLFPTSADIIHKVRDSSLYKYPLYTIGESFDEYFLHPKWRYYRAPDGLELVEFHGYTREEKQDKIVIQFLVDYHLNEIEPYTMAVNGQLQEEEQFDALMEEIFQVENPFELDDELEKGNEKNAL